MQTLINQPEYIKSLLLGDGTPTYGPVPVFPTSNFLAPRAKTNPFPYSVKAAKTNAPINAATPTVITARKNLAIPANAEPDFWFGLIRARA